MIVVIAQILVWVVSLVASASLLFLILELCAAVFARVFTGNLSETPVDINYKQAIVIPAHNEQSCIRRTLQNIRDHIKDNDLLVVVAHHCSDETASIASEFTPHVIEDNATAHGKAFALFSAQQYLRDYDYDVVTIVDADCIVADNTLNQLASQVMQSGRTAQAIYLMDMNQLEGNIQISSIAFYLKNYVRMLGLASIGGYVHITGSGFSMPKVEFERINLQHSHIVEDMRLGSELVISGKGVSLCDAYVYSEMPTESDDAKKQRQRWEHGHLSVIFEMLPQLLVYTVGKRDFRSLLYLIDLLYPPLVLYILLLLLVLIIVIPAAFYLSVLLPAILLVLMMILFGISIVISTYVLSNHQIKPKVWLQLPIYIVWKLPIYISAIFKKQSDWNKTIRS